MMKFIVLTLTGILCLACSSKVSNGEIYIHHVDLSQRNEVSVFDLVDSISVVALETSDSCLVSCINCIRKKDNKLYILDGRQETFFCFNMDGTFLFKIHSFGNGPEEYQHIESFSLDEQGNIYLVEPWGIIHQYDSHGKFVRRMEVFDKINVINDLYYVNGQLITANFSHKVTIGHISLQDGQISTYKIAEEFSLERAIPYQYGESVYLVSSLAGQICKLGNENYTPYLQWDFGKANNDTTDILEKAKERQGTILGEVGPGKLFRNAIVNAFENDRFNFMILEYDNDFIHVVYDKLKKEHIVFRKTKEKTIFAFCDLTDGALIYNPPIIRGNPGRDLTCIRPEMLDASNARRLAKGEEGENNPSITIFWLKNK